MSSQSLFHRVLVSTSKTAANSWSVTLIIHWLDDINFRKMVYPFDWKNGMHHFSIVLQLASIPFSIHYILTKSIMQLAIWNKFTTPSITHTNETIQPIQSHESNWSRPRNAETFELHNKQMRPISKRLKNNTSNNPRLILVGLRPI